MVAKLELYRKFTNALAISVVISVAWIGYEVLSFHFSVFLFPAVRSWFFVVVYSSDHTKTGRSVSC